MIRTGLVLALLLGIPYIAGADVVINEIAWMGTSENANDEWIELYNNAEEAVNVDGWTITDGTTLTIPLLGTIDGNSYVLLERTDDTTVPSVAAFLIYTGALANDGRTMVLKREDGTAVDQVVGGENWSAIGGNNTTKETPQRTPSGWTTGTATPGAASIDFVAPAEVTVPASNDSETVSSQTAVSRSGGGSRKKVSKPEVRKPVILNELNIAVTGPKIAYVNQEVNFEVMPEGLGKTLLASLKYVWNFGDTYTGTAKKVKHTFQYPGEYIVVVEGAFGKHTDIARHEIKVLPVTLTLSKTKRGDIEIKNNATYEVDLGGFSLESGVRFVFPKYTFIKGGATLIISKNRVAERAGLALKDATGTTVTEVNPRVTVRSVVPFTRPLSDAKEISALEPVTSAPTTTVIRIGGDDINAIEEGVFSRIFTRFSKMFGS